MKIFLIFTLLSLFCFSAILCDGDDDGDVVVLTEKNFDEVINGNQFVLVEFYAPWCGHCKHLAPEYKAAASVVKDEGIVLGKVDATVESELASKFGIRGYPTLFFFRNGNKMEYTGPRKSEGIVQWVRKKSGPLVAKLADAEALKTFLETHPITIVDFSEQETSILEKVAGEYDAFSFAQAPYSAADPDVTADTIRLFRDFDETIDYDGSLTSAETISKWVADNAFPYVESAPNSWGRLREQELPIGLLVLEEEDTDPESKEPLALTNKLAKANKGKFNFAFLGPKFLPNVKEMGVSGNKLPTLVVISSDDKRYPYPDEYDFEEGKIQSWLNGIADGSVAAHFKSEEEPENNDGPVKVIVGKTFESIVLDPTKDVFIEFYAPWCGHCKSLAPTFDKLGEHFAKNDKIVIAKIDATANDNPSVQIRGFPTLYFFTTTTKQNPIEYNGGRDLDSLVSWISENATPGFVSADEKLAADDSNDDDDGHDHDHEDL